MRLTALVGSAVVAALVAGCGSSGPPTATPPITSAPQSTVGTIPDPPMTTEAAIYLAALGPRSGPLVIRDHAYCSAMLRVPRCVPVPISEAVQDEMVAALGDDASFSSRPPGRIDPHDRTVITLGPITATARRATVTVESFCGPLCGQGDTVVVSYTDDGWRRTGTTGVSWIS